MLWGEKFQGILPFRNNEPTPVAISKLDATCGCTALDSESFVGRTVAPAEELTIPYEFSAGTNPGPKTSTVTLVTSGGAEYRATVQANVIGTWSLDSDRLDFGDIEIRATDENPSRTMAFHSGSDRVEAVDFPQAKWLVARQANRVGGLTELFFEVHPEMLPEGVSTVMGRIRTTCATKPEAVFQVRVRGVASLSPSVNHVALSAETPKIVRFRNAKGDRATLVSAAADDERIRVRLIDPATAEISNPSGSSLESLVQVTFLDEGGSQCIVSVSTF